MKTKTLSLHIVVNCEVITWHISRAVTKGRGPGICPTYYKQIPGYFHTNNEDRIKITFLTVNFCPLFAYKRKLDIISVTALH